MTTDATMKEIVQQYLTRLQQRGDWASLIADDMVFTSHAHPGREIAGRDAFLQGTSLFYGMIVDAQVNDVIVSGEKACTLTRYRLQPPNGAPEFASDVAEIFTVRNGKIASLAIYFDTAPYPKS
jgi:ketosteroid isomerase-like protein